MEKNNLRYTMPVAWESLSSAFGEESNRADAAAGEAQAEIAQAQKDYIEALLKGQIPKTSLVAPETQQARDFERMTYRERLNLFNSNPHEYNKLSGMIKDGG